MKRRRYSRPGAKPIDLAVVRDVRRRLRELAEAHPELCCEPSEANRAGWEETLREIFGEDEDDGEDEEGDEA